VCHPGVRMTATVRTRRRRKVGRVQAGADRARMGMTPGGKKGHGTVPGR
jgi:hypothetical protein